MNVIVRTSAFKTGNSVAVRLPKTFAVRPGDEFELVRRGGSIELRPVFDPQYERQQLDELIAELESIGSTGGDPNDGRIEFPDRPGLYV